MKMYLSSSLCLSASLSLSLSLSQLAGFTCRHHRSSEQKSERAWIAFHQAPTHVCASLDPCSPCPQLPPSRPPCLHRLVRSGTLSRPGEQQSAAPPLLALPRPPTWESGRVCMWTCVRVSLSLCVCTFVSNRAVNETPLWNGDFGPYRTFVGGEPRQPPTGSCRLRCAHPATPELSLCRVELVC